MDILQIQEKYSEDNSIKSLEPYAFQPISGTQLNGAGQITIRIENQDSFFLPRRSWLQIEGKLVKAAAAAVYADVDDIALTNNGLMYLFDNIKYELSGQEIESLYHPGHATTMLGLTKYSSDYNAGPGLNQCWSLDTSTVAADANLGFKKRHDYIIEKTVPKGSFRFNIDLESIFGFCADYDKVMYGFIHTLTLVRSAGSDDAIFKHADADLGKIIMDSITWFMPRVEPNDGNKYQLYKTIESKSTLDVGFRMRQCTNVTLPAAVLNYTWRMGVRAIPEQPRQVIIAFQTGKANSQLVNASIFDHCNVSNMYVVLNNTRYPAIDFHSNFAKNHYDHLYKNMCDFRRKFYGLDQLVSSTSVDPNTYKDLFPIFVFDVSKQSERLQQGVVDITVQMMFSVAMPANTVAYAMIISDRKLRFQSDGKKMSVIF